MWGRGEWGVTAKRHGGSTETSPPLQLQRLEASFGFSLIPHLERSAPTSLPHAHALSLADTAQLSGLSTCPFPCVTS